MDKERILLFIRSIEENLEVLKSGLYKEVFNDGATKGERSNMLYAVASIRNDASDLLKVEDYKSDIGNHNLRSEIALYEALTHTRNQLICLKALLYERGCRCYLDEYEDNKNYLVLKVYYNDEKYIVTKNISLSSHFRISFPNNYITTESKPGKFVESYTVPFLEREKIFDIISMSRPKTVEDIPADLIQFNQ